MSCYHTTGRCKLSAADALEKLRGYARHDPACKSRRGIYPTLRNCGLTALLHEIGEQP